MFALFAHTRIIMALTQRAPHPPPCGVAGDPSHFRRNAFVGTYQAVTPPIHTCPSVAQVLATNETERWAVWDQPSCESCRLPCTPELMAPCCVRPVATVVPPADPSLAGGAGPAWAMARAAFWGGAMVLFARAYCDHAVHPLLHRHLTQSGIVLYIAHPIVYPYIVWGLHAAGLVDPAVLYHVSIPLVFLASFACYALINATPWTAAAFGVIQVDFQRRPLRCCGGRGDEAAIKHQSLQAAA